MLLNRWAWVSEDNSLDRPFLAPFDPLPRPRPLKWYSSLPLSHHRIQKQSCSPEHKLSILGTTCICHWGGTIQWTGQKCSTGNWPFKCMLEYTNEERQTKHEKITAKCSSFIIITFRVPFAKCFVYVSISVEPWDNYISLERLWNAETKYIKTLEIYCFG